VIFKTKGPGNNKRKKPGIAPPGFVVVQHSESKVWDVENKGVYFG
jgi:hypothetical protein